MSGRFLHPRQLAVKALVRRRPLSSNTVNPTRIAALAPLSPTVELSRAPSDATSLNRTEGPPLSSFSCRFLLGRDFFETPLQV